MINLKNIAHKIFVILKWVFFVLAGAFIILVIVRIPHAFQKDKTNTQVAIIHATKLQVDDVMGKNLPPDPGAEADKTVQGIDANKNGIRDDVELAIYKEYPNSAKTRAVLLQYALALQMETIQPIVNTVTATEVIREETRANICLADTLVPRESLESSRSSVDVEKIYSYINFIENKELNTEERKNKRNLFLKNVRSFSDLKQICDVDYSKLPN
ncbi:MAG: hypothetical protein WC241_01135 [Candidatus Paceibacterota bacterium]|jgi:hypothetical protein